MLLILSDQLIMIQRILMKGKTATCTAFDFKIYNIFCEDLQLITNPSNDKKANSVSTLNDGEVLCVLSQGFTAHWMSSVSL